MTLLWWALYMVAGGFAGVLAGLFGVGGGLILVPVLLFCFAQQGLAGEITAMAIATSLATIVATSITSLTKHHRLGNVIWSQFKALTPGFLLGTLVGSYFVVSSPGVLVQGLFALFTLSVGAHLWLGWQPKQSRSFSVPIKATAGVGIGGLSSVFGIGGGTLTVPFLRYQGLEMRQAVGTSAACGLPIALFSSLYYGLVLPAPEVQVAYSLGYIYLPAFMGIVLVSPMTAIWGAKLAQKMEKGQLQKAFAILLIVSGLRMMWQLF